MDEWEQGKAEGEAKPQNKVALEKQEKMLLGVHKISES